MYNKQKIRRFMSQAVKSARENPNSNILSFANLISLKQYKILYEKILDFIPAGKRVLDWGCGNGHCSYFLNYFGYDITAYSLAGPPVILAGKEKFKFVAGVSAEPTKLPFNDNEFAAVIGVGVLEHVRETGGSELGSLKELCRITEPGGIFICAHLPNRLSWIEFMVNLLRLKRFTHRYRYSEKLIIKLWHSAGWQITSINRYNWLPKNFFRHHLKSPANNRIISASYDLIETACKFFLYPFNQNYLIIAQRPAGSLN